MLLVVTGCTSNAKEDVSESETPSQASEKENTSDQSQKNTDDYSDWSTFYNPVGKNLDTLYFDGPPWTPSEMGLSRAFIPDTECAILVTSYLDELNGDDVFEAATKKAFSNFNSVISCENIDVSEKKEVNINGMDMIHYVGTTYDAKSETDLYVTGYVFEFKNAANGVMGIVFDKEQSKDLIKMVTEYTDHLVTTVRETQ